MADGINSGVPQAGMTGGFLHGVMSTLGPQIERRAQQADQERQQRASQIIDLMKQAGQIEDPASRQANISMLWDELNKLYKDKESRGLIQRAKEFFAKPKPPQQGGPGGQQGSQTGPPPQGGGMGQPPQGGQPGPSGLPEQRLPSPQASGAPGAGAAGPAMAPAPSFGQRMGAISAQIPTTSQTWLKEQAQIHKDRLEEIEAQASSRGDKALGTPVTIQDENGEAVLMREFQRADGSHYWERIGKPGAKPSSGYIRAIGHASADDAKRRASQGEIFKAADGSVFDTSKLSPNEELIEYGQGGQIYYARATQDQVTRAIGGEEFAVGKLNQVEFKDEAKDIGPARIPSRSTTEQLGYGPEGQPIRNTFTRETTPQVSGIPGRPLDRPPQGTTPAQPAQPTGGPPPDFKPSPPPTEKKTPSPAPNGGAAKPQDFSSQGLRPSVGPGVPGGLGVSAGVLSQTNQVIRPVMDAADGLFGNPAAPDVQSLADFADLADSKESQERLGRAIQVVYNNLRPGEGKTGTTFWDWIKDTSGFSLALSDAHAAVINGSVGMLTPREQDYFNTFVAAMSKVVGVRSITRASAAQSSVSLLEQELPAIGRGVPNSSSYYTKMENLATLLMGATRGTSKTGLWRSADLDRVNGAAAQMAAKKKEAEKGNERIKVLPPGGGKDGTLPRRQLKDAIGAGYIPVDPDKATYDALPDKTPYMEKGTRHIKGQQ